MSLLGAVAGCAPRPPSVRFGDGAFHPRRDHYQVLFLDGAGCRVAPLDWALLNYEGLDGRCDRSPREGRDYTFRYQLDHDGDGRPDADSLEQRHDLLLEHRVDGTVIAVRTVPIDPTLEARALSVLAHGYLDWISGSTTTELDLGDEIRSRTSGPRLVRLVSERDRIVGGQDAYEVRFDRVDADRAEVDPAYVPERREMVLLRPGHHRWRSARMRRGSAAWPMLVVISYVGAPERLELHRADFESLLSRIVVDRGPDRG